MWYNIQSSHLLYGFVAKFNTILTTIKTFNINTSK